MTPTCPLCGQPYLLAKHGEGVCIRPTELDLGEMFEPSHGPDATSLKAALKPVHGPEVVVGSGGAVDWWTCTGCGKNNRGGDTCQHCTRSRSHSTPTHEEIVARSAQARKALGLDRLFEPAPTTLKRVEQAGNLLDTLDRLGLLPAALHVISLLDGPDGAGKGDQRWRGLETTTIAEKAERHGLRALGHAWAGLDGLDPDSGKHHAAHAVVRYLQLTQRALDAEPTTKDPTP